MKKTYKLGAGGFVLLIVCLLLVLNPIIDHHVSWVTKWPEVRYYYNATWNAETYIDVQVKPMQLVDLRFPTYGNLTIGEAGFHEVCAPNCAVETDTYGLKLPPYDHEYWQNNIALPDATMIANNKLADFKLGRGEAESASKSWLSASAVLLDPWPKQGMLLIIGVGIPLAWQIPWGHRDVYTSDFDWQQLAGLKVLWTGQTEEKVTLRLFYEVMIAYYVSPPVNTAVNLQCETITRITGRTSECKIMETHWLVSA